ncbi:hypothetical protein [uncultured Helicobacter sp.]|uniref:hypothetical protein n=1 Tax=uncultured Helicobacter sp. TaxID=175537 RepID=UPI00374F4AEB
MFGNCDLTTPALNASTFSAFSDGCIDSKDNTGCTMQKCQDARQTNKPILNERVYDGENNVTETIVNGVPVPGTIRPRILAEVYGDYNQTIQAETKALAFANMVNGQTYNKTLPLNAIRKTSYAYRAEDYNNGSMNTQRVFVRVKPSNSLYDKTAYLYVMLKVQSVSNNFLPPVCTQSSAQNNNNNSNSTMVCKEQSFYSNHYYLLDTTGTPKGFYRHQGFNIDTYSNSGIYATFSGTKWNEGGESNKANYYKKYTNILQEVEKNKYFIEEKAIEDTYGALNTEIEGLPKARAYWSKTTLDSPWDAMIGEIYETIKSDYSNIPSHILAANNGVRPHIRGLEAPVAFTMYVLLSDKELTNAQIGEMLITKKDENKKTHAVYNSLGVDTDSMRPKLDGDGVLGKEIVDIYLVGNEKKLSAYANVVTRSGDAAQGATGGGNNDVGAEAYIFYWFDDVGADPQKGSIGHLAPDNRTPKEFKKYMPATLNDYEIFKNQDMSKQASQTLKFGYGTGEFDQASDCKTFSSGTGGTLHVCLPWWRVERDYDEQIDKSVGSGEYKKFISMMKLPSAGKQVSVCTKVDPLSNAIYNNTQCAKKIGDACYDSFGNIIAANTQVVTCTSYYNKLAGEDCYDNPYQKKCFYDNCPTKVKENCTLTNTIGFNDLKSMVVVDQTQATGGRGDIQLKDTRLEVKTYGYRCPATFNVEVNQVCAEEQTVMMYPAKCTAPTTTAGSTSTTGGSGGNTSTSPSTSNNTTGGDEQGNLFVEDTGSNATDNASMNDLLNNKSNLVYCSTHNPIITNGTLSGFAGTCPGTGESITCGFEPMVTETKVCVQPIIKDVTEIQRTTQTEQRACTERYVNIMAGEADIYQDDPTCYRSNTAADSKKGNVIITGLADITVKGLSITKNNQTTEESLFCTYNGSKGKMKGNCQPNNDVAKMQFTANLQDSREIIFSELISGTDDGVDLGGWENTNVNGLGFDSNMVYGEHGNDIVPRLVVNPTNTYKSGIISLSSGLADLSLFPDINKTNLTFRWRYCTAPNTVTPTFSDINKYGFVPNRGYFDVKPDWGVFNRIFNSIIDYVACPACQLITDFLNSSSGGSSAIGRLVSELEAKQPFVHYHTHYKIIPLIKSFTGCHNGWHGQDGHWRYSTNKLFKLFSNSGIALSILFPTPSNYEVHFFNRDKNLLYSKKIPKQQLESVTPGEVQYIMFNDTAKLYKNGTEITQSLKSCYDDPFSPVGGGTLFGVHSDTGSKCDIVNPIDFIRENSIYSVTVIDLDTQVATTKELTYPLPFLNNINYTYAQKVESRRYTCCQEFSK